MIPLKDIRGKTIYIAHDAIAVVRPVVAKETEPAEQAAVMLVSGQIIFVVDAVEDIIARLKKTS